MYSYFKLLIGDGQWAYSKGSTYPLFPPDLALPWNMINFLGPFVTTNKWISQKCTHMSRFNTQPGFFSFSGKIIRRIGWKIYTEGKCHSATGKRWRIPCGFLWIFMRTSIHWSTIAPDPGVLEKPPDWALLVFLGTERCDLVWILGRQNVDLSQFCRKSRWS